MQIGDKGGYALLETLKQQHKLTIDVHGNPISSTVLSLLDKNFQDIVELDIETPKSAVFHPNHGHDGFIHSLQADNVSLRNQLVTSQGIISDLQKQIDSSALKIVEYEQELDRKKFSEEQLNEEVNGLKLRMSQLADEQNIFKQNMNRERHEMNDRVKQLMKQMEMDSKSYEADKSSLAAKLHTSEVSEHGKFAGLYS